MSAGPEGSQGLMWTWLATFLGLSATIAAGVVYVLQVVEPPASRTMWVQIAVAVLWPLLLFVGLKLAFLVPQWKLSQARTVWTLLLVLCSLSVAGVGALMSYQNIRVVLQHWGESAMTAALGPVAIVGLLVVGVVTRRAMALADAERYAPRHPEE